MLNRDEIFELRLEDYTQPRYKSAVRSYYGTQNEIADLMNRLRNIDSAKVRYSETIEAVEYYDLDNELTHTVAGRVFPILKPVEEVCRFESKLTNQYWYYHTYEGSVLNCYASQIDVCQSFIATDSGYERCVKACFTGLCVYHHGVGWANPCNHFKGFPGMVVFDGERATAALFASQEHYEPEDLDVAMDDVVDITKVRPSVAAADILGEG